MIAARNPWSYTAEVKQRPELPKSPVRATLGAPSGIIDPGGAFMLLRLVIILAGLLATLPGCGQSSAKKSGGTADAQANAGTTAPATTPGTASDPQITADSYPKGYYTGFDGGGDSFALLVPGFREYTVDDA